MALDPQYTTTPHIEQGTLGTANTGYDGTGTTVTCFTAPATGSFIGFIRCKPLGTNASASVARFWVNNGATSATAANNFLIGELSLPVTTVSQTAALVELSLPVQFAIPGLYKILGSVGTAANWQVTVIGGDY
jgi:hypothetical protein